MSSLTPKPAILIIHGAYFLPQTWHPFILLLESHGFVVSCPHLPTCGDPTTPPTATFHSDVLAIQSSAKSLISAGHPIIVLAHSFGGVLASAAITPDLFARGALSRGGVGGVIRMIYLSAFIPLPGKSLGDIFAKHGFLSDVDLEIEEDGKAFPKNAPEAFYNDLSAERAEGYTRENVTHNLGLVGDVTVSDMVPWKDGVRATYVFCERDLAVKIELQKAMVRDAVEVGGRFEGNVTLDCGHCAFLSRPEEVAGVVRGIWEGVLREGGGDGEAS